MGRLVDWRLAALRLSQDQSAKAAAERQHNFEQLIDTLDAQTKAKAEGSKDKRKELVDEPLNGHVVAEVVVAEATPATSPLDDHLDMLTARDGVSTVAAVSLDPDQAAIQAALEAEDDAEDWQEAGVARKKKEKRGGKGERTDKHDKYDKKKIRKERRRPEPSADRKPLPPTSVDASGSVSRATKPHTNISTKNTPPAANKADVTVNKAGVSGSPPAPRGPGSSTPAPVVLAAPTPAEATKRPAAQPVRQLEFAPETKPQPAPPVAAQISATSKAAVEAVQPTLPPVQQPSSAPDGAPAAVATSSPAAVIFRKRRQQPPQQQGASETTFSFTVPSNPTTPLQTEPPARLPEALSPEQTALRQPTPTFTASNPLPDKNQAAGTTEPTADFTPDFTPDKGAHPYLQQGPPLPMSAPYAEPFQPYVPGPGQPFMPMDHGYYYPPYAQAGDSPYPPMGPGDYPMMAQDPGQPHGVPFYPSGMPMGYDGAAVTSMPMNPYFQDVFSYMQQQMQQQMGGYMAPMELNGQGKERGCCCGLAEEPGCDRPLHVQDPCLRAMASVAKASVTEEEPR